MKGKPILIGCGGIIALCSIVFIALVIWLMTGPEGGVRLPNEMEPYATESIERYSIEDDEQLLAYYDVTIRLDGSVAVIVTSERVIYHNEGINTSIRLADVTEIHHRYESMIGDVFEVSDAVGHTIKFEIAPFNQGETLKNVLFRAWDAKRAN